MKRPRYIKYGLISTFLITFPFISFALLIEFAYKYNDVIKNIYCKYINEGDFFCKNFIFEHPGRTDQYNTIWFALFIFCGIASFYYGSISKSAYLKNE
jgi:hypothetical protein